MENKPRVDLSAFESFESAVLLAKKLVAEGILRWTVSASGFVRAKLDDSALNKVGSQEKIREFRRILAQEITRIIDTVAHGWNEDIWYRSLFLDNSDAESALTAEELREISERISLIKKNLIIDGIRERVLLRRTTKRNYLEKIHWETCVKKQDQQEGEINLPFLTLVFVLTKAPKETYIIHSGHVHTTPVPTYRRIPIDCHIDDIDAIIQELQVAKRHLKQLYLSSVE